MDLHGYRRKRRQKLAAADNLRELYPHDLQFYKTPPSKEIYLKEFEDLAMQRLRLLRILERATETGLETLSDDWKQAIYAELDRQNLTAFYRLAKSPGTYEPTEWDLAARRADHISHFILRLAYCHSAELQRWFLRHELEWFKLRFGALSPESVHQFLALNDLVYFSISEEEKRKLRDRLQPTAGVHDVDTVDFYKLPYVEVPSLVHHRAVYLEKGFAYVPNFELITCVSTIFQSLLKKALVFANRNLSTVNDRRINNLIVNLNAYVDGDYFKRCSDKSVKLAKIETFAARNYPLCMRHVHDVLSTDHHLKYGCRCQYGLFLKSIGLRFEDSMALWKREFTKKMTDVQFRKRYAYQIKHTYGKVGNMIRYPPESCRKIIEGCVGPREHHGCPFAHWDSPMLATKLTKFGFDAGDIEDIVTTASNGHFQVACSKYYESVHGRPIKNIVGYPHQYFKDSLAGDKVEERKAVKCQRVEAMEIDD